MCGIARSSHAALLDGFCIRCDHQRYYSFRRCRSQTERGSQTACSWKVGCTMFLRLSSVTPRDSTWASLRARSWPPFHMVRATANCMQTCIDVKTAAKSLCNHISKLHWCQSRGLDPLAPSELPELLIAYIQDDADKVSPVILDRIGTMAAGSGC